MVIGRYTGVWEDVITLKRCDSSHVGLKIVR